MAEQEITLNTIYEILKDHTARFDRMDQRFDNNDTLVDGLESRFDRLKFVQNSIALRLISIETIVSEHSTILRSMHLRLDALHGLVEELERRTGRIEQE